MHLLAVLSTVISLLPPLLLAAPYNEQFSDYNLNSNKNAQSVLDYDSSRPNQTYTPSPQNWRSLPVYTILLDKWADGDPTNNDFFKSPFEYDYRETQLRFGGDLKGLRGRLDYLYGMGIRVIFMSGTPFLNMLWQADSESEVHRSVNFQLIQKGYSPLDFSVLDPHWGTIQDWRDTIDAIHARGMYFMADFTVGTMSDLIGFSGCVPEHGIMPAWLTVKFFVPFATAISIRARLSASMNMLPIGKCPTICRGIFLPIVTSRFAISIFCRPSPNELNLV